MGCTSDRISTVNGMGEKARPAMTERHVRPDPKGGWNVTGPRNERPNSHHKTDTQAIAWARTILRQRGQEGRVVVHDRAGQTRTEHI